jgi:hypothetical protein
MIISEIYYKFYKMKYYRIRNANELHITGKVFPQVKEHRGWSADNYEYLAYQIKPGKLPEREFVLDHLVLDQASMLTDFISDMILHQGFIVSERVKKLLNLFSLPQHKYYNTIIKCNRATYSNYYWFLPIIEAEDYISLESSFQIVDWFDKYKIIQNDYKFQTLSMLKEFAQKEAGNLRINPKRVLLDANKCPYDFFRFTKVNFDFIISERLKVRLEKGKITGYEIKEIDWLEAMNC